MNNTGYMALHYGTDYIYYAIKAVIDSLNTFHVFYSARPSHGSSSGAQCPDSENDLHALAWEAAGTKLRWHVGTWRAEHEQRAAIHQAEPYADAILVVDSDEIYGDGLAEEVLSYGYVANCHYLRLPFVHMWRSFKRGFPNDPAYPARAIFPKRFGETMTLPTDRRIWHYGYAQRSDVVKYKMLAHGHVNEFRRDVDWFRDVFMANRQTDCHPIGSQYWNAQDLDLSSLPMALETHPYRHLQLIP